MSSNQDGDRPCHIQSSGCKTQLEMIPRNEFMHRRDHFSRTSFFYHNLSPQWPSPLMCVIPHVAHMCFLFRAFYDPMNPSCSHAKKTGHDVAVEPQQHPSTKGHADCTLQEKLCEARRETPHASPLILLPRLSARIFVRNGSTGVVNTCWSMASISAPFGPPGGDRGGANLML